LQWWCATIGTFRGAQHAKQEKNTPKMNQSRSFEQTVFPSRKSGALAATKIRKMCPGVFHTFSRSTNGNVVVSEAIINPQSKSIVRLEQYWLNLEPSFRQANREKQVSHDREAFNAMDTYAYNFNVQDKISPRHWRFTFVRLPNYPLDIHVSSEGVVSLHDPSVPQHNIEHMHVEARSVFGLPLPLIAFVRIFQINNKGKRSFRDIVP
jgi:hypothetical protein